MVDLNDVELKREAVRALKTPKHKRSAKQQQLIELAEQRDPGFGKRLAKAWLTPEHKRSPEQIELVEQLGEAFFAVEPASKSDPVDVLSLFEALLAFAFSVVMAGPAARWLAGPGPSDLGFGGMAYLLAGWVVAMVGAAIVMAIVHKVFASSTGPRLIVNAFAVLLLVLIAAPAQQWQPSEKRIEDGQPVSLWRAHREGWFDKSARVPATPRPQTATDLRNAVMSGDLSAMEEVLAQGVDVNSRAETRGGRTALMLATGRAAKGDGAIEMVRALLDKGAAPNLRDEDGETALLYARGNPALVTLLAERGADPNLAFGQSSVWTQLREADPAVVIAVAEKFPNIRLPVSEKGKTQIGPLHVFAGEGDLQLVQYFLARGLGAGDSTDWGHTPLYFALKNANETRRAEAELLPLVETLLAAGADVNASSVEAWPPLTFAGPYPEVVRRLIDAGADVNAVINWNGEDHSLLDIYGTAPGAAVLRAAGAKTVAELRAMQARSAAQP